MKHQSLPLKLFALVAALMCALGASAAEAYAEYTSSNTTLTFYYDNNRSSRTGTTYDLNTGENQPDWCNDGTNRLVTHVVFKSSFGGARPTSTAYWFWNMENLESFTGTNYFKTANVTNMVGMFGGCTELTILDVNYLNTANVTDMEGMFYGCSALTSLDLSNFNTASVTDMSYMFVNCYALENVNLSNFNTANVTSMQGMFGNCYALVNINLSSFNTANVTDMRSMFSCCSDLATLDLRSFNTTNVEAMDYMFYCCSNLAILDLSSFNTSNVWVMDYMFYDCSNLTTIYVSSLWSIAGDNWLSEDLFTGCTKIRGGAGTTYDPNHTNVAYAHIDGGPSNPGYLTEKVDDVRGDVNGDGSVNISDVTTLIDYLLSGNASGVNLTAADCNQDSSVNISDVTTLIDYLLSGAW